jgi:hypothetical protein
MVTRMGLNITTVETSPEHTTFFDFPHNNCPFIAIVSSQLAFKDHKHIIKFKKTALDGQEPPPAQLIRLSLCIAPNKVATLVRLKIPRRNQDNVSFPYPNPPLHLPANPTQTLMSILTPHKNTIETQQSHGYAQNIVNGRKH